MEHSLQEKSNRLVRLVMLALLAAISYGCVVLFRIPVVQFLSYEPKDVMLALTALWFGPLAGIAVSVVVSLIEMVTVSTTGLWGFLMNVLASTAFILPAGIFYRMCRRRSFAWMGLLVGVAFSTGMMLLWNYLVTPIYMGIPRQAVVPLLWSMFLPFNLLKDGLNAAATMLLWMPLHPALQKAHLLPPETEKPSGKGTVVWVTVMAIWMAACVGLLWFIGIF